MASVSGYKKNYVDTINTQAYTYAYINGNDLYLRKNNGNIKNLGAVKGPQGITGPTGSVDQTALDAKLAEITPGVWASLSLKTGWSHWGSGWSDARYRKIGNKIELDGVVKRTGGNIDATGSPTSSDVANALPAGYRPAATRRIGGIPYHGEATRAVPLFEIYTNGTIAVFFNAGVMTNNTWIGLTGRSFYIS